MPRFRVKAVSAASHRGMLFPLPVGPDRPDCDAETDSLQNSEKESGSGRESNRDGEMGLTSPEDRIHDFRTPKNP